MELRMFHRICMENIENVRDADERCGWRRKKEVDR